MKSKVTILIIFAAISLGLVSFFIFVHRESSETPSAIIVDNLGLDERVRENITFVRGARKILESFGVKVDYIGVNNATLEVYRNLARYNLVILRVHSGLLNETEVCFFSSEKYADLKNHPERYSKYAQHLVKAVIPGGGEFIGIRPSFITECIDGNFSDSIIIAMGCKTLAKYSMAEAFIKKGAKVYIGWTQEVTPDYTDNATLTLLKRFFQENATIQDAVKGLRDPEKHATLGYYPEKAANLRPKEIIEHLLEETSPSTLYIIDIPSKIHMAILLIPNWLNFSYRRFFRNF